MSCGQDGNLEEALSPPIQWRARRREEALPNNSNASEPEPGGDEKHDLERDPSEGNATVKRKEQAEVEPRSCQKTNKRKETHQKQEENRRETKPTTKERRETKQNPTRPTTQKEPQTSKQELSFDTVVEGSDAESKVGQRLSGAPPWETQRECTNELIGSDLVEHEKLGRHP